MHGSSHSAKISRALQRRGWTVSHLLIRTVVEVEVIGDAGHRSKIGSRTTSAALNPTAVRGQVEARLHGLVKL